MCAIKIINGNNNIKDFDTDSNEWTTEQLIILFEKILRNVKRDVENNTVPADERKRIYDNGYNEGMKKGFENGYRKGLLDTINSIGDD